MAATCLTSTLLGIEIVDCAKSSRGTLATLSRRATLLTLSRDLDPNKRAFELVEKYLNGIRIANKRDEDFRFLFVLFLTKSGATAGLNQNCLMAMVSVRRPP